MKILLIEDERHKREEISSYVTEFYKNSVDIVNVDSVRDAVLTIGASRYNFIILDMALPTFSNTEEGATGGLDQALGGIEVLRALKSKGIIGTIIIITQHPLITVSGKTYKLADAIPILSKRYEQNIIGGFIYKYRSHSNNNKLVSILGGR
jgi:Response regulator containing CheY-like receiver, AAA-type ATPase, and DNA-binding domains